MFQNLHPQDSIKEIDIQKGLKMLLFDGAFSQIMGVLTGGAFLVAYALLLGANNKTIGLLAAIGPFTQILQIPTMLLITKYRVRKLFSVLSSFSSRLFWILIALLPWFVSDDFKIPLFLLFLASYFGLGAISGCAFNSWMRDFIPEKTMGSYFAKRMRISVSTGAILSLIAALSVDHLKSIFPSEINVYSLFFIVGGSCGIIGVFFLSKIPEPKMIAMENQSIRSIFSKPFNDSNFRGLLLFLGSWNFAINLAAPFFTVYILKRLELNLAWVIGLSITSQVMNVTFLKLWGNLSDRFSNKSVLGVSGFLFLVSIIAWPFTTMPEKYFMTIPLLIGIHALLGMATAGVALCSGNIALKLAPKGTATSYLATNSLISGLAATVAPILAGFSADWFDGKELSINLQWISNTEIFSQINFPALHLRGLDFLFVISFLFGLYALHRLIAVHEKGEVTEEVVYSELLSQARKSVKNVSNVAGLRHLTYFPYSLLMVSIKKVRNKVIRQ